MKLINNLNWPGWLFCLLLLIGFSDLHSQNLQIRSVSLQDNEVVISYDLLDENLEHKYTLSLYTSEDNFVQPLKMVDGDIGVDLSVGGNKQVVWRAKEELGEKFKGDVSIEIKGKLYIPFVTLNNFEDISAMKRGRPYNMTWSAGRGSSVLTFDLFNNKDEIVHTYTNIANVGEYELEIPKDIKPGKNYRFRITDQNNKEDVVFTPNFLIKRKIPFYMSAAVLGLAGTGGFFLTQNLGGEAGAGEAPLLPDPITPFSN